MAASGNRSKAMEIREICEEHFVGDCAKALSCAQVCPVKTERNACMYERSAKLIQEKYRQYLVPAVMSTAALAVAALVDDMMVGLLLGAEPLAGIGACSPVIQLINAVFLVFSIGSSTNAAIALGHRDSERVNRLYTVGIWFGFLVSLVFVALMELAGPALCGFLGQHNETIMPYILDYYRPLLFVAPCLFLTLGVAQYMKIDGHPKMASYIAIVANVINLGFDYCFISGNLLNWGVTGASASTVCGYLAAILMVVPYLRSKEKSFHRVRLSGMLWPCLKEIFSAGSARFFQKLADFLKRYTLNSLVLYFLGNAGLSVLTACNSLLFFSTSVTNGGSDAFLPIVGSLYGEKDYYGIRQCIRSAVRFVLAGSTVLLVILFAFPAMVGQAFGLKSAETAQIATIAFRLLSFAFPLMGMNTIIQTVYNTTGRHRIASAMSFLSEMVYMCLFCLLFGLIDRSILWLCYPASYLASLLTALAYARRVRKKEGVRDYLLLKEPTDGAVFADVTIHATKEEAVGLSTQIIERASQLGLSDSLANLVGVAIEETVVCIVENTRAGQQVPLIDILLSRDKEEKLVIFRSNGVPFDPLTQGDTEQASGIAVLKKIVKSAEYARQLGFNNVVLKF